MAKRTERQPKPKKVTSGRARKPRTVVLEEGTVRKLVEVLLSIRRLGPPSYPPTLSRLLELSGERSSNALTGLGQHPAIGPMRLSAVQAGSRSKPKLADCLRGLAYHEADASSLANDDHLVEIAVRRTRKPTTQGVRAAALLKPKKKQPLLPAHLRSLLGTFHAALAERARHRAWPASLGSIRMGKTDLLFLLEDVVPPIRPTDLSDAGATARVEPGAAAPTKPPLPATAELAFARAFEEAFARLDRDSGDNYVLLADLRRELPQYSQSEFDAYLHALRRAGRFTLDASDGRQGRLAPEQLAAGIEEGGSILVFAARR